MPESEVTQGMTQDKQNYETLSEREASATS